jgi:HPt (histidine-containing phosphotransfer) domain-containing protein
MTTPRRAEPGAPLRPVPFPSRQPAVFDPTGLHGLGADRPRFEREVILDLLMRVPYLMQSVTRAVILRDARNLASNAHELRRCCWALGAEALGEPCGRLEAMGERGEFADARDILDQAQREHRRLTEALAEHLATLRAA